VLSAATARALADVAARANDVLHAYDPGYVAAFDDVRGTERIVRNVDPWAVVPPDGAYLIVADRSGARGYSRDGRLSFADGRLQTAGGDDVLGYAAGGDGMLRSLRADPIDVALGRTTDAHVESDGSVVYTRTVVEPRSMQRTIQRVVVGTIALARFPAGTNPRTEERPQPHLGRPNTDGFGPLGTHARGLGTFDVDRGLAKLQEAYLALRALQAAQLARSKLDAGAMDLVK
jgi:hypothetical protein